VGETFPRQALAQLQALEALKITCPVKIDLHHHLLQNRRNAAAQRAIWWEKLAYKFFAFVANRPALFSLAGKLGRAGQRLHPLIKGTRLDPARAWTASRGLPVIADQTFHEFWRARRKR